MRINEDFIETIQDEDIISLSQDMGDELCVLYTGMEKLVDVYTFIASVQLKGLDDITFSEAAKYVNDSNSRQWDRFDKVVRLLKRNRNIYKASQIYLGWCHDYEAKENDGRDMSKFIYIGIKTNKNITYNEMLDVLNFIMNVLERRLSDIIDDEYEYNYDLYYDSLEFGQIMHKEINEEFFRNMMSDTVESYDYKDTLRILDELIRSKKSIKQKRLEIEKFKFNELYPEK